jgi:Protein of unknown function (DUF4242)
MHTVTDVRARHASVRFAEFPSSDGNGVPSGSGINQEGIMQKYVIERELPGAGSLSEDELHTIATKSNAVIADMGPRVQWVESFVTPDKLYCIYLADSEATVLEHAKCGGFPANVVSPVKTMFDPTTGD